MAVVKPGIGLGGLSGTSGGAVFATLRDGTVIVRERPGWRGSPTRAQTLSRQAFRRAAGSWGGLTREEQASWLAWARLSDPFAGADGAVRAYVSLAVRWLAVNPMGTPPKLPPAAPFAGDAVAVAATAAPGALVYSPDRANAAGIVTELLGVRVRSWLANPRDRDFRALGQAAFSGAGAAVSVPVKSGRYATAVRFVRVASGQSSSVLRLGVLGVG